MTTARLRKTFKYPSDSEEDEARNDLDEQEQNALIESLRSEDDRKNAQFNLLFTFLPLLCNLPFVVYLLSPPLSGSRYSLVLLCLLSITSLLSTAYSAHFIPIPKSSSERMKSTSMQSMMVENGPAERYLPYLNGAICLLLFFAAWAQKGATNVTNQSNHFWIWCLVPGVIFTFYHLGRRAMLDVDIGELERLKYDYKGA